MSLPYFALMINYLEPDLYRGFAQRELSSVIEPAISQTGGKVLAAVHVGSTVNNPPSQKVWEINFANQKDGQLYTWGWIGPNDVDIVVIHDGQAPVDRLVQHYSSIREETVNSLEGKLPQGQHSPVLDPFFFSKGYIEGLIENLSVSKQGIEKVGMFLNDPRLTKEQSFNRTLIEFVNFAYGRSLGLGAGTVDTETLSGLLTMTSDQMHFLAGQDYAQDVSGRMAQAYWLSEIEAMKGEKEGKKKYIEMALARAREEAGNLEYGRTFLRLDFDLRDSMVIHGHLRRGSKIRDPYGDFSRIFLPESGMVGDIGRLHSQAKLLGTDLIKLLRQRGGVVPIYSKPEAVERIIKESKVFHTPEEFAQAIQNL